MSQIIVTSPDELRAIVADAVASAQGAAALPEKAQELEILSRKKLLTPKEVQQLYGIPASTLAQMRCNGRGPEYVQEGEGTIVYYEQTAIQDYLSKCRKKTYQEG